MQKQVWICHYIAFVLYVCVDIANGQGRLLYPPGRSSLWRFGYGTPINNNDNALSCGGIQHRWKVNQGKCGVCGDPWDSKPRENEAGGLYAREIISAVFKSGDILESIVEVANDNGGFFEYRICANNNFSSPVKEECLEKGLLTLEDGISTRYSNIHPGYNKVHLKIPNDLTCEQCVLQWKYRTADQYGCETSSDAKEVCGFGYGEMQTEYYACADIAVYADSESVQDFNKLFGEMNPVEQSYTNNTATPTVRKKRTTHLRINQGADARFGLSDFNTVVDRIRRRTHQPPQIPDGINVGNPHLNGIVSHIAHAGGSVRSNFNLRRNGIAVHPDGLPVDAMSAAKGIPVPNIPFNPIGDLFNTQSNPMQPVFVPPEPAIQLTAVKEPTVRAVIRPVAKMTVKSVTLSKPTASLTVKAVQPPTLQLDPLMHRNFIDPLNPLLQPDVAGNTQKVLSRSNYQPTKKCVHCPFDQCLDDKLRIDHLFPGLFDSPTTFFECKRFERVFELGNYDVVQEGLPDCGHPRFRRQLLTQFDDDDIGCCATRPQVILPLTVEAENDTFSVVQLGDAKKQFIVQGICGKGNTTTCTVCAAENNFQWVLVYDPRVNSNPPVSFVPVKFPHYCKCYNFLSLKGKR